MTSLERILAAASMPFVLLLAGPSAAQPSGNLDGRWALVNDPDGCTGDGAFGIRDGELTFGEGDPFRVILAGFTLQVLPPETCDDCRTVPFDVMPDGSLQRFIDGTTEIYRPCLEAEDIALQAEDPQPPAAAEPESEPVEPTIVAAAEPDSQPADEADADAEAEAVEREPAVELEPVVEPEEDAAEPAEDAASDAAPSDPEDGRVDLIAAAIAAEEAAAESDTSDWMYREVEGGGEAYIEADATSLVVGCVRMPAPTVYISYYPEFRYRFPVVNSPRGEFNVLMATVHARWGLAQVPLLFDADFGEDDRVVYTRTWAGNDPFLSREQAYMMVAALRTSATARVQSLTLNEQRRPSYRDELSLLGSGRAIGEAMRAGGCAGFLAGIRRAIEEGEIIE